MPEIKKQLPPSNGPKIVGQKAVLRQAARPSVNFDEPQSAWEMSEFLRLALYGRSGSGKTTFWSTFPKPILACICSGGQKPGELKSIDTPDLRAQIEARVCLSVAQMDWFIEQARSGKYKTFVLDHCSGFQDIVLKEILNLPEIPAQRPVIADNKQTWGKVAAQCKDIFRDALNLQSHVVMVAQERDFSKGEGEEDESIFLPYVGPGLTPSIAGWLNANCDYVLQTYIRAKEVVRENTVGKGPNAKVVRTLEKVRGEVDYCLRTAPSGVFMSKFRLPKGCVFKMPPVITDPSFDKMNKLVEEARKAVRQ